MSDINGSIAENQADAAADVKGKGKGAAAEPTKEVRMDETDTSDEEDHQSTAPVEEEDDPDSMEEIDPTNIITSGRRTRGRQIDFAKAAKELPEEDEEDEEDDDFQGDEQHEGEDTKMEED